MFDCLGHVALATLTALSWLGLGTVLLRPLGPSGDRLLDALNRLATGAIALGLLLFGAALAGALHRGAYIAIVAVTAAIGAANARRLLRGVRPSFRGWPLWQSALVALVAAYALVGAFATCAPVSSADALYYHASAPALFAAEGEWRQIDWAPQAYQPFTVEMLMLGGILLRDVVQGAFAPFLLAVAATAAVYGAADRLAGRSAGILAAAIFFAQPFMLWEATSSFNEPGLALGVALAGWNIGLFLVHDDRRALVLAGVLAGGTMGMKYGGIPSVLALAVTALLLGRTKVTASALVQASVPAILVAAPWYVKNALVTGNPFFPLLFGGADPEAVATTTAVLEGYGHGRSATDAVLLPFRLLGDAAAFDRGEFLSPLFLAFAPLALLAARHRAVASAGWAGIAVYLGFWFYTSQQVRFLTPVLPGLAVLAALGIVELGRRGRLGAAAAVVATAGACATGLAVSTVYAAQFAPVITGFQSPDDYLRDKTSYYDGVEWLNRHLPPDARVAVSFGNVLYIDRPYVVVTPYILPRHYGSDDTRDFVQDRGLTHAALLEADEGRVEQFSGAGGRIVARVSVREVLSRTQAELGPAGRLVILELPPARRSAQ